MAVDVDPIPGRVGEARPSSPEADLVELADEGAHSPGEGRVACLISILMWDETLRPRTRRHFPVGDAR